MKSGNQANSAIRAILGSEGWVCNDPDALSRFEEEVQERNEAVRIDWNKQKHGRLDTPPTTDDITRDFNDRLTGGDVSDVDDHICKLNKIDLNLFSYLAPHLSLLRIFEANYFKLLVDEQKTTEKMMTLLDRFIDQLPEDKSRPTGKQVADSLRESQDKGGNPYYSILRSVVEFFLLETEPKRRTILLHGAPNSGKTTFIRHMREIFNGYDHRPAVKFAVDMRRRDAAPSLVTSDEWALSNLNKANIDDTKRMLEGEGTLVE